MEFEPRALQGIILSDMAEKRLGKREGEAFSFNPDGTKTDWKVEGSLLDVYCQAVAYEVANPDLRVVLREATCMTTVL